MSSDPIPPSIAGRHPAGTVYWVWEAPGRGYLATVVEPRGGVSEWRQHPGDDTPHHTELGSRPLPAPADWSQAIGTALAGGDPEKTVDESAGTYLLARDDDDGALASRRIACPEVGSDPAMTAVRDAILRLRSGAEGGRFSWRCLGGRLFWVFLATGLLFAYWIVRDSRSSAAVWREGERHTGVVTGRSGADGLDRGKFITVRFTTAAGSQREERVSEYLSAAHWESAEPGTTVALLHHPDRGTFLEADVRRFEGMKRWLFGLPALFLGIGVAILALVPRRHVGTRADGAEYVVAGDRVTLDDRDLPVSRFTLHLARLLWTRGT